MPSQLLSATGLANNPSETRLLQQLDSSILFKPGNLGRFIPEISPEANTTITKAPENLLKVHKISLKPQNCQWSELNSQTE
jgi:hypothetical protein